MWQMEIVTNKMLVLSGVMKSFMSATIVAHNLEQNDDVSFFRSSQNLLKTWSPLSGCDTDRIHFTYSLVAVNQTFQ